MLHVRLQDGRNATPMLRNTLYNTRDSDSRRIHRMHKPIVDTSHSNVSPSSLKVGAVGGRSDFAEATRKREPQFNVAFAVC